MPDSGRRLIRRGFWRRGGMVEERKYAPGSMSPMFDQIAAISTTVQVPPPGVSEFYSAYWLGELVSFLNPAESPG